MLLKLLGLASKVWRLDSGASSVKSTCWSLWFVWCDDQLQALDPEDSREHVMVRVSDRDSHTYVHLAPNLLTQVSDEHTE